MKYIYPLFLILFCLLFSSIKASADRRDSLKVQSSSDRVVVMRGDSDFFPFEFNDENGQPQGFNVDILREICGRLHLKYDLKLQPWYKVVDEFRCGQIDMVTGITQSIAWTSDYLVGDPVCMMRLDIVSKSPMHYSRLSDLSSKRVLVQRDGWAHTCLLRNNITDKIIAVENLDVAYSKLKNNEAEAVLCTDKVAQWSMLAYDADDFIISPADYPMQGFSFMLNNLDGELLSRMNSELIYLRNSGEYQRIYDKWFSIPTGSSYKGWLYVSGVLLLVCVLFGLISRLLHYKVKKVTALLEEANSDMQLAFDSGNISLWEIDIRTDKFKSLYGESIVKTGDEFESFYERVHPDDRQIIDTTRQQLLSGVPQLVILIRYRMTDSYIYLESRLCTKKDTQGRITHFLGTQVDVTEKKRAEIELENSRRSLDMAIRSSRIIAWDYNLQTRQFRMLYSQGDKTVSYYDLHKNEVFENEKFVETVDRAVKERSAQEVVIEASLEEGAQAHYLQCMMDVRCNLSGTPVFVYGTTLDVTRQFLQNMELENAKIKAERSGKLKSAFLANMSHEIRTPLNAIVGFSQLMMTAETQQEKEEYNNIIVSNNEILLQLINDVLDLSKIEAGFIELKECRYDVVQTLDNLIPSLKLRLKPGVEMLTEFPYKHCYITADSNRMIQVVTNFGTNAAKFTFQGSVTVGFKIEKAGITFYVRDTGVGISAENCKKVFDRFEKLNDFAQGTGLGLSICQSIVEARGGRIGVSSVLGKGSTFWAWIPTEVEAE